MLGYFEQGGFTLSRVDLLYSVWGYFNQGRVTLSRVGLL